MRCTLHVVSKKVHGAECEHGGVGSEGGVSRHWSSMVSERMTGSACLHALYVACSLLTNVVRTGGVGSEGGVSRRWRSMVGERISPEAFGLDQTHIFMKNERGA